MLIRKLLLGSSLTAATLVPSAASATPATLLNKNFCGWAKAQHTHFGDGGTLDQVFAAAKR